MSIFGKTLRRRISLYRLPPTISSEGLHVYKSSIMKTIIIILPLFFFSFSLESAQRSQDLTLEQVTDLVTIRHFVDFVTIQHFIGMENGIRQFIIMDIPVEALPAHLLHGDLLVADCTPPQC